MTFEDRFIKTIQQDIKIFIFFNILSTLFRIIFLVYFREQLVNVTPGDIVLCLWYGFLLSRKLSGCIMAVSFSFVPYLISLSLSGLKSCSTNGGAAMLFLF